MNPALTSDVADTLAAYVAQRGAPNGRADFLYAALDADRSVTSRKDLPVHLTCGAIIRHPDGRVLQIRHRALDLWLFPGGHLEPEDESLITAALREANEETGLKTRATEARPVPIDIDVHAVPANDAKSEPEHHHADFRYVVELVDDGTVDLQADEVTDWRWIDPNRIDNARLAERLAGLQPGASTA